MAGRPDEVEACGVRPGRGPDCRRSAWPRPPSWVCRARGSKWRWCERWLEALEARGLERRTCRPLAGPSAWGSRLDARFPRWCERWLEALGQGLGAPHRPPAPRALCCWFIACAGLFSRGGVSGVWRHSGRNLERRTGLPSPSFCVGSIALSLRSPARSQVELSRTRASLLARSCRRPQLPLERACHACPLRGAGWGGSRPVRQPCHSTPIPSRARFHSHYIPISRAGLLGRSR